MWLQFILFVPSSIRKVVFARKVHISTCIFIGVSKSTVLGSYFLLWTTYHISISLIIFYFLQSIEKKVKLNPQTQTEMWIRQGRRYSEMRLILLNVVHLLFISYFFLSCHSIHFFPLVFFCFYSLLLIIWFIFHIFPFSMLFCLLTSLISSKEHFACTQMIC